MGELGSVLLVSTSIAFIGRTLLSKSVVESQPIPARPGKQFKLEMLSFMAAGTAAALALLFAFEFPFEISGLKMIIGYSAMGLFAAVDLSLIREHRCIQMVLESDEALAPPMTYSPMTRGFSLLAVAIMLVVTSTTVLVVLHDVYWLSQVEFTHDELMDVQRTIIIDVLFVMGVLFAMTMRCILSYSRNLKLLFGRQTEVLESVSSGELDVAVPVVTNNEFGVIAGHTNTMISGLKERLKLKRDVQVAHNIQQAFLPKEFPQPEGLDCWGGSVFSDETGGDYYDFLEGVGEQKNKLGLVMGDVTGHGVGAAVFMASARAVFRLRMGLPGPMAQALSDINRFVAHDAGDTGNFITVFYCQLDPATRELEWSGCGHDPALLYRPASTSPHSSFEELSGTGIPLGVIEDWEYESHTGSHLETGDVLVLGTDGIWEAESPVGEWYGKDRLRKVIAKHAHASARTIGEAVLLDVARFRDDGPQEDDITLLVVKAV